MKIAILTSGGLAPCLSSAVGYLIETYTRVRPDVDIICYLNGYRGLLLGDSIKVTDKIREQAPKLQNLGGSPIGNSRVRLKNAKDCVRRGLIKSGESPERIAAMQLMKDEITILHTIGGDDTNMSAGDLSVYLRENFNNYHLNVIGLPKTIDNDVYPISQTLGCQTAAEQGALFFRNVVSEFSSNPNMLIVHEIMGRNSGWLAAKTAFIYMARNQHEFPELIDRSKTDVHAIYIPETTFNLEEEVLRLKNIMEKRGCVNVFLSEGSCSQIIIAEKESKGEIIERDAFGHIKLDTLNPGKWFSEVISKRIGAEKVLVQKSGYFCRAAPANDFDRQLVKMCVEKAVQYAIEGKTGLCGPDEENNDKISCINYSRVSGGKPFKISSPWFQELIHLIGQPVIPLDIEKNPTFFTYEPNDSTVTDKHKNIDYTGSRLTTRLVSISTVSLLSVSSDEADAVQKLLLEAGHDEDTTIELCEITFALMACFKATTRACKDIQCTSGSDSFRQMIDSLFVKSLQEVKCVSSMISLNSSEMIEFQNRTCEQKLFTVVLDPTDGSSNIDVNVSIGTIFGVYANEKDKNCEESIFNQKGKDLLIGGYCLYGSATILMISFSKEVYGFTLDVNKNCFVLSHRNVKIPDEGDFYSTNESYFNDWSEDLKSYIIRCKNEKMSLRYIGTLVADIHRTLLFGGIFLYPPNEKYPEGKLKLLSEVNPIAFLIEKAGGKAIDLEGRNILDKKASSLDETSSFAVGSSKLIDRLMNCCYKE